MTTPLLETESLTRRYPGVTALDELTLRVDPGIVGLVGANGAGKTTLFRVLLGLVQATKGDARVLGLDAAVRGDYSGGRLVGGTPVALVPGQRRDVMPSAQRGGVRRSPV